MEDLNLWWPKLRKGGVFSGHDYLDGKLAVGVFGVKSAVDELVKEHKQKLYVTKEDGPTWYMIKG